jgi:hypothetical protein
MENIEYDQLLKVYNGLINAYEFAQKEQFDEITIFVCFTHDYVCENCYCLTEDYSVYDWEQLLKLENDIGQFLNQIEFEIISKIGIRYLLNEKYNTVWLL